MVESQNVAILILKMTLANTEFYFILKLWAHMVSILNGFNLNVLLSLKLCLIGLCLYLVTFQINHVKINEIIIIKSYYKHFALTK